MSGYRRSPRVVSLCYHEDMTWGSVSEGCDRRLLDPVRVAIMLDMRRWLVLLALMLGGCGLDARSLTYPGASVFQSPNQDFHFHYLAPPWEVAADPQDALVQLTVAATIQSAATTGYSHRLRVLRSSSSSSNQAAVAQAAADQAAHHTLIRGPVVVNTLTHDVGWEVLSYQDLPSGRAYHRETFYTTRTQQVVQFALHSAYPPDEIEINDLFLSYSPGPDPGTPGPDKTK